MENKVEHVSHDADGEQELGPFMRKRMRIRAKAIARAKRLMRKRRAQIEKLTQHRIEQQEEHAGFAGPETGDVV